MADRTSIEWTDATWNPIVGCSVVSPGCTNCYAMRLAGTRLKHHPSRVGLTIDGKAGPVWTGETRFDEKALPQPLRWRRPRKIFVCAHSDLFHEATPDAWIDRVFAVMALCPQHTFQVLTKRPERMHDYVYGMNFQRLMDVVPRGSWPLSHHHAMAFLDPCTTLEHRSLYGAPMPILPLPNVWLGVTAEDQTRADERVPVLLTTPAARRFVSVEPMLGPISLRHRWRSGGYDDWLAGERWFPGAGSIDSETVRGRRRLDWVICGGESGPNARPMHPDWVRSLRDQCAAAGVPFFFKQWGEWAPSTPEAACGNPRSGWTPIKSKIGRLVKREELYPDAGAAFVDRVGKRAAGRRLDGVEHDAFPMAGGDNG